MAPFKESSQLPDDESVRATSGKRTCRQSLAFRMFLSVLAFSCAFSVVASAIWTYVAYDSLVDKVKQDFERVERTLTPGIGKSLWELDNEQLKKYTEGICSNATIKYARISADDGTVIDSGTQVTSGAIVREIPILHRDANYSLRIGSLLLQSDRSEIMKGIAQRLGSIFLFQTAIVFCVAFFLFVLVNRLVTSHLLEMATYIDTLSHDPLSPPLRLNRKSREDEFDKVVNAFNEMRDNLNSSIRELLQPKEALRRSEGILNEAQRIAHLGSWEFDPEKNLLSWSDEMFRIYGRQPGEIEPTYKALLAAVHPEDRDAVRAAYTRSLKEEVPFDIVHRIVDKSGGEIRYLHQRCEHTRDESGRVVGSLGTAHDITEFHEAQEQLRQQALQLLEEIDERQQAQEALQEQAATLEEEITERRQAQEALTKSERFLEMIIETEPEGVKMIDRDGKLITINRAGLVMMEADSLDQVKGLCIYPLIVPEYRDAFRAATEDALKGNSGTLVFEMVGLKGGRRWIDAHTVPFRDETGKIGAVLSITRDITQHKRAEESIRMLSEAVNQSPVSIMLTAADGTIIFVNPKFTQLTGYLEEESLGRTPRIIKSEHTPTKVHQELWATITSGKVWDGILQNRKKNGELLWEHVTIAPIFNGDGITTNFVAIKEDITERKALEAQLFQAQKMEAVGHLAGGIAHDFNNILTAIIGFTHIVEMKMSPDDPQRPNMKHILDSADKAAELTRSLLVFSRKQIIAPKPVDLNDIVVSLEKFLQRIIGEDIELRTVIHPQALIVDADRGQIEQVLMNLASNARDAMPKGGLLAIETQRMEMDAAYLKAHGYGNEGEYAVVSVTDTGIGMAEAVCKRIFEPFFSTKEVGKGTGLGMSIAYGIIKQHNGFINVYSEPGMGTTFTVYIPLVAAEAAERIEMIYEPLRGGTETVLVADDDAALRELAEQVLGQSGYTVITASDGEDALQKFGVGKEQIRLVILDIIMPRRNGKEVFEEIGRIKPDCKVLFISGYTADIIHKRGVLDERLEFISKPFRPQQLLKKVREVLDA